ncbi:MAG: hypothetical protein AAF996_06015 [Pseudomonadota bacterium]
MNADWVAALRFAALPGASSVLFERHFTTEDGTPTTKHRLTSFSISGAAIGDDRDYDLLKAAITPLEILAASEQTDDLRVQLDLETGQLQGLE